MPSAAVPGVSDRRLDPAARLTVDSSADAFAFLLSKEEGETPAASPTAKADPEPKPAPPVVPEPEPAEEPSSAADPEPESAAESEDDAPADEPAAPEPPRKFRVKAGDVDEEVTEEELLKGYMRHADYTRKRQADAEKARAAEADYQAVKAERAHYAKYLGELREALTKETPAEPNWTERAQVLTPEQYTAEHAAWQEHQKNVRIVEQRAREAQAKVAEDQRKEMDAYLGSEAKKLIDAIPAWADPVVAERERKQLWAFAEETLGYSKQELDGVYDHRAILALRKAHQADRAEAKKPAVRAKLEEIKVASPGPATGSRRTTTEIERKFTRAKKTGHWQDAAALIAEIDD